LCEDGWKGDGGGGWRGGRWRTDRMERRWWKTDEKETEVRVEDEWKGGGGEGGGRMERRWRMERWKVCPLGDPFACNAYTKTFS